jgi:hypothetical protein
MKKIPFVGQTYQFRSLSFDAQRCINLYPVLSDIADSKSVSSLMGTAGYKLFCNPSNDPTRSCHTIGNGRCFFVLGNKLFEIFSNGSFIDRGTLLTYYGTANIADNGVQLCIVDGVNGYIFTFATNAFVQITSPAWLGSNTVTFCDGYFVFVEPNTQKYYISALYDGTSFDPLDFKSAEGSPDNLVAAIMVHKQLWLFGVNSIEIAYNSGNADFPFTDVQGAFIEYGCLAPNSIVRTANTVFWIGQDSAGQGIVFMAEGYQPKRISNFAIESRLQQIENLSDASCYGYQEDGHYFYVLNFSASDTSLVYDITSNLWHERASYVNNNYARHRISCHTLAFGLHLVGDFSNGKIYTQSLNYHDYNGEIRRWERITQYLSGELQYFYTNALQVDMQVGTGIVDSETDDLDPQAMLSWSDDSGKTWSAERWQSIGKVGEYLKRVIWRRLGRSRNRLFKIAGNSRTPVVIIQGLADIT